MSSPLNQVDFKDQSEEHRSDFSSFRSLHPLGLSGCSCGVSRFCHTHWRWCSVHRRFMWSIDSDVSKRSEGFIFDFGSEKDQWLFMNEKSSFVRRWSTFVLLRCWNTSEDFQFTVLHLKEKRKCSLIHLEGSFITNSGSEGNRDMKSANSLLSMYPFGLRKRLVNLLITKAKIKYRSGT